MADPPIGLIDIWEVVMIIALPKLPYLPNPRQERQGRVNPHHGG